MNNLIATGVCAGCLMIVHFWEPYYIVGIPIVIALGIGIGYFLTKEANEINREDT